MARPRNSSRMFLLATIVGLAMACPAWAQAPGGRGMGGGGDSHGKGGRDQGAKPPKGSHENGKTDLSSGNAKGFIVKYTPSKTQDDDALGELLFKTENNDTVKLELRKKDDVKIRVGEKDIAADDYGQVLLKGLYANVQWDSTKKGPKTVHFIKGLTFEAFKITGQFMGVDGTEFLKVRCKPSGDVEWPAPKKKEGAGHKSGSASAKGKTIASKTLKLRFMENVSAMTDTGNQPLVPGDLQKSWQVTADIVYGSQRGLIIKAQIEGEKEGGAGGDKENAGAASGSGKGKP